MKAAYGFFSFTEVTDPSEHRSYNAWHQLDHLPEQFPLPGVVYGQRWVSTPACRAARVASAPALDPIDYVTCYLMAEPIDETIDEFFALGAELHRLDRFHRQRRAHLTGPFRVVDAWAAPRTLVSAAAVPFRPHRGIYVMVDEPCEHAEPDTDHGAALVDVPGVAGGWTFSTVEGMTSPRWTAGVRRITVWWLDDDPLDVAARVEPLVTTRPGLLDGAWRATFAGPFETITAGQWDWFDEH
ncbi:MAG: hypothetical protein ACLPVY_00820 [Acidimicrobiia bacterium]